MAIQRTTVRLSEELAARLRRAHYLSKRSQNDIVTDALDHWLTNPRAPGCTMRRRAEAIQPGLADQIEKEGGI